MTQLSFSPLFSHADFSTFILKFDCQGNLIKQNKILRSKEYGDQTIYQITSYLLDNVKLLIYQFGGDSMENSYYLANMDDNLNISEKSKFFSESSAYKYFVDQYSLSEYFTTSTKWLFEMPYFIYDRQGDLIFTALMFQKDSIFIGRIMLIKFKENGEVVIYNQVEMYNEEKFLVYPNPFKDYITINLPFDSSYLIEILDIHGKLIYQTSGSVYFNLNLSTLIPSTYNVRFTNQNHNQTHYQKIIKLP